MNGKYKILHTTATTANLGNRLNGKLVLYLRDLVNPNNGFNLIPNPLLKLGLGVFFGIPPTGKFVNIEGATLVKMKNGKILQKQDFMDNLEFMNQLGIIPRQ